MSWLQKLNDTYENCQSYVGMLAQPDDIPLVPICHTTQKAHVEIVIDAGGNFKRASVVPKNESRTIIPCTEDSAGRTSGEAPHPLCDKLQYVAKDFSRYASSMKQSYFESYARELSKWCRSSTSHPKVVAVEKYVTKGRLIGDLIGAKVLIAGVNRKLLPSFPKKGGSEVPPIFSVVQIQDDVFIRWIVETSGDVESKVWTDRTLWQSWIQYYVDTKSNKALCQVSGTMESAADQHPAKIRNDADKAKLISSNDSSGFTFRGRFLNSDQACTVGFEVSQRAHYALRWLIGRQGYVRGDYAVVSWAVTGGSIPDVIDDSFALLGYDVLPDEQIPAVSTAQEFARRLNQRIKGYGKELKNAKGIVVMSLGSATPGRMAVLYYRELENSDFLRRIEHWHQSTAWLHRYRYKNVGDESKLAKRRLIVPFVGAPAPVDIALAAYGTHVDEKLKRVALERLLPCIVDGYSLPRDLVESVVRRASNRAGLEAWEWEKTLSIACSLYKKLNEKESYEMSLEPDRRSRDYLYGRLLAIADSIEQWALKEGRENRQTNAARLMQRFAEHPFSTWRTLELALLPYKARLGPKAVNRTKMISEVVAMFERDDFVSDRRLNGEFLLGYHCQREAFWKKPEESSLEQAND